MMIIFLLLILSGSLMTLFSMAKVAGKADRELERLFNDTCEKGNDCASQMSTPVVNRIR